MPRKNDAEVKIRIPKALRDTVERLAVQRMTSSGSIFRQAALDYIKGQGLELKESAAAPTIPAKPSGKPVTYHLKKSHKIVDIVRRRSAHQKKS